MIRGIHVLALAAIALGAASVRSTEVYATRYQSLPVLDWVESRPPLAESASVPAAADLVRGLLRVMPLLATRDDVRPRLPAFGPPAHAQTTIAGVRDSARIDLGTPGVYPSAAEVPVRARFDAIVFNRAVRAGRWATLLSREMDIRDPESGQAQIHLSGPDEPDGVWVIAPREGAGVATVAGHRGTVGFMLQVTYWRPDANSPADGVDLSARAEIAAREAAAAWTGWLADQVRT